MLNYIVMMGRLTHDPELRKTQEGTSVCTFRIACDRDFKTKGGEKETDFIDVVSVGSAPGNFSKAKRGTLVTT